MCLIEHLIYINPLNNILWGCPKPTHEVADAVQCTPLKVSFCVFKQQPGIYYLAMVSLLPVNHRFL